MKNVVRKLIPAVFLVLMLSTMPLIAWADDSSTSQNIDKDLAAAQIAADLTGGDVGEFLGTQSNGVSNSKIASRVKCYEYSGQTFYDTAISQAKAAYPHGAKVAIIAGPDQAWIDALSAAGLAGCLDAPILFSEKNSMNSASLAALKQLGVVEVIIVGGPDAVGRGVESDLKKANIVIKKRLWGNQYYDTQLAIFNYGVENHLWNKDLIILATGTGFADALSMSPIAYAMKAPVFVTAPGNSLTVAQKAAWGTAAKDGYGKRVAIVGGPYVISDAARQFANQMRAIANGSGGAEWIWGQSQYDTSSEIAKWATGSNGFGFKWDYAAFTTGNEPWDALAGSVYQGKSKAVLLLANSSKEATVRIAGANKASIQNVRFFGGKWAMTPNVRMGVADALDFPPAALPNFKVFLDVGHGQNDSGNGYFDPGAIAADGSWEHNLSEDLVKLVAAQLRAKGVDYYINDSGPYKLRHSLAYSLQCDEIISFHFNAGGGSGSMTLIHSYNDNEYSATLQSKIHNRLVNGTGLWNLGPRRQLVAILGGKLPAVLLETCFIDNWNDLSHYYGRKSIIATDIANGIMYD